jgi:hypothetical protein
MVVFVRSIMMGVLWTGVVDSYEGRWQAV